jgi:hypothetical protein
MLFDRASVIKKLKKWQYFFDASKFVLMANSIKIKIYKN